MTKMTCWKKLKCACIRKWKHGRSGDKNIIQFLSTFMQKTTSSLFCNCFLDCARSCEPFWLWQLYSVFTELVCWATSHPATKKGKSRILSAFFFFSVASPRTLFPSIWRYLCTIYICGKQRWANTVFWTEYEYEYYSESEFWPNTNTNNIRFFRMSEYEYE